MLLIFCDFFCSFYIWQKLYIKTNLKGKAVIKMQYTSRGAKNLFLRPYLWNRKPVEMFHQLDNGISPQPTLTQGEGKCQHGTLGKDSWKSQTHSSERSAHATFCVCFVSFLFLFITLTVVSLCVLFSNTEVYSHSERMKAWGGTIIALLEQQQWVSFHHNSDKCLWFDCSCWFISSVFYVLGI